MTRINKRTLLVLSLSLMMVFGALASANAASLSTCPGGAGVQCDFSALQQCMTNPANCASLQSLVSCIPQCDSAQSLSNCIPQCNSTGSDCGSASWLSNCVSQCGNQPGSCVGSQSFGSILQNLRF